MAQECFHQGVGTNDAQAGGAQGVEGKWCPVRGGKGAQNGEPGPSELKSQRGLHVDHV